MKRMVFALLGVGMRNRIVLSRSTWWLWCVVPVPFRLYAAIFDQWRGYVWFPDAIEQVREAVKP